MWGKLGRTQLFFWLIAAYHKSQIATTYTNTGEYRMIVDTIHHPPKKHNRITKGKDDKKK
jgi:hypothetical protein